MGRRRNRATRMQSWPVRQDTVYLAVEKVNREGRGNQSFSKGRNMSLVATRGTVVSHHGQRIVQKEMMFLQSQTKGGVEWSQRVTGMANLLS